MRIIVPLSGGIDSAFLLADALRLEGAEIYPVEFHDGNMQHQEVKAARRLVRYYRGKKNAAILYPITSLHITNLNLLAVKYSIKKVRPKTAIAMEHTTYWSGYKALFYSSCLAYGGAIGADAIWLGTYNWNDHFVDEIPNKAKQFAKAWKLLYPDLIVPKLEFPLDVPEQTKASIIQRARKIKLPLQLTWSCFYTEKQPCGKCLGCQDRIAAFAALQIKDPAL